MVKSFIALGNDEVVEISSYTCTYVGFMRTPEKGAVTTINCAVNPELNSQQAIYYTSNSRPEQASETARYV